jgi:hypothetical protein
MARTQAICAGIYRRTSCYAVSWHDVIGHHRYYGSSATTGEPIAESRRGLRPRAVNVCGF